MNTKIRRWGLAALTALLLALPLSVQAQSLVNINTASVSELRELPGIGATKANAIVDYRAANGAFTAISQITNVNGIGAGTFSNIESLITVGDGTAESASNEQTADPVVEQEVLDLTADGTSIGDPQVTPPDSDGSSDNSDSTSDDTAAAPSGSGLVNINTASSTELQTLPGIGPAKAMAIIEYRDANGAFTDVGQLDNVPGIGPATMNNVRSLITIQ